VAIRSAPRPGRAGDGGRRGGDRNAVFHATGTRVRDLPIRVEDVLASPDFSHCRGDIGALVLSPVSMEPGSPRPPDTDRYRIGRCRCRAENAAILVLAVPTRAALHRGVGERRAKICVGYVVEAGLDLHALGQCGGTRCRGRRRRHALRRRQSDARVPAREAKRIAAVNRMWLARSPGHCPTRSPLTIGRKWPKQRFIMDCAGRSKNDRSVDVPAIRWRSAPRGCVFGRQACCVHGSRRTRSMNVFRWRSCTSFS